MTLKGKRRLLVSKLCHKKKLTVFYHHWKQQSLTTNGFTAPSRLPRPQNQVLQTGILKLILTM